MKELLYGHRGSKCCFRFFIASFKPTCRNEFSLALMHIKQEASERQARGTTSASGNEQSDSVYATWEMVLKGLFIKTIFKLCFDTYPFFSLSYVMEQKRWRAKSLLYHQHFFRLQKMMAKDIPLGSGLVHATTWTTSFYMFYMCHSSFYHCHKIFFFVVASWEMS